MHLNTKIVGARHRGEDALKFAMSAEPGDEYTLERDPQNPYDANAIRVMGYGVFIGFIPKSDNADLAAAMDEGRTFTAVCDGHASYYEPTLEINEVDTTPEAA